MTYLTRLFLFSLIVAPCSLCLAEAPVCDDVSDVIAENTSHKGIVLSCSDDDGIDSSTYTVVQAPTLGIVSGFEDAPPVLASYLPDSHKSGLDSFTFTVSDLQGTPIPAPATVSIDIRPLPQGGLYPLEGDAGCFMNSMPFGICDRSAAGLTGIGRMKISPDGKNIYTISIGNDVLAVVNIAADGTLSQFPDNRNCLSRTGDADYVDFLPTHLCQLQTRLDGISDIVVSPDGKNVYVSASNTNSILVYTRDTAGTPRGALNFAGCIAADTSGGCTQGHAQSLLGVSTMAISPDGKYVYALGSASTVISVLARNADTGLLSQANNANGCFSDGSAGCTALAGVDAVINLAIAPDGNNLYTFSTTQVNNFVRDITSGILSQPQSGPNCLNPDGSNGCLVGRNFTAPLQRDFVISPQGSALYLVSDMGIAIFSRDENGLISQPAGADGCINSTGLSGCTSSSMGDMLQQASFSPDGKTLYSTYSPGFGSGGILGWSANTSTGLLASLPEPFNCISDSGNCVITPYSLLQPVTGMVFSPSGSHFYAAISGSMNGILVFAVNRVPACNNTSASAPGGAVDVSLPCDDPDGEAVSISVIATPVHGTLGAVDSNSKTVRYSPANGFAGSDSFSFAATDGTLGNTAIANITVLAATPTVTPTVTSTPTQTPAIIATPSPVFTPVSTPTAIPTLPPGNTFQVSGVVTYNGEPVAGALVSCESLGAVLTEADGSFNCGSSSVSVEVTVTKAGYTFGPRQTADGKSSLVFAATGLRNAPAQCRRTAFERTKLSAQKSLVRIAALAGNARRLTQGKPLLSGALAVRASRNAYIQYQKVLYSINRLPDFSDLCPEGIVCRGVDSSSRFNTVKRGTLKIRRYALKDLTKIRASRQQTLKSKALSMQVKVLNYSRKLAAALGRMPAGTKDCG